MASQFADLYARVDGLELFGMALALAHGRNPWQVARTRPTAAIATSSVYRVFDSRHPHLPQRHLPMPTVAKSHALQLSYPDHLLFQYPKSGRSLARDFKWLGSYRYGILHMGGCDAAALKLRCAAASALLGWPLPYADTAF
jgi:hypothetical protein